jgi:hypothetical protein
MNKTLWLYGVLVFAGGLIGGALTSAVFCRTRTPTAAAPVVKGDSAAKNDNSAPRRIVAASEFLLLDSDGKPRAKIEVNDDGKAGFSMYDRENHPRAQIVVDTYGAPSVRLYDTTNKVRLSLEISTDGVPTVRLLDRSDRPRAVIGVDGQGEAGLNFYAQDGRVLRELP